ncbi:MULTISPECIES: fumarylacetoacetate hydrolase family protein [unclassified Rhizobium]|uniref:fumarylacetoacetate hydrolase family protein n=1 Tax=unclassified Rhizobium TaxID=2613769 RepID=UPI001047B6C0|nr:MULTISPECIES: fumarylacetoacetate hydrolase family protein [unclassified Rhizobium]MBB3393755.1 2-keto-4-pentenoate hydratase [Rhizobium sp. BK060]MBB4166479.1 2-keto-4-pentenoate hydratase [Rhizobium sp. BK538]TCM81645.1 2-keto-4-pentenoate hydratase [Rhizobium sp. BK068]
MAASAAAPFDPRALAAKLHGLRRSQSQAPTAEFALPADLRHAMDAQNFLVADEAIESNAWKVTVSPDGQAVTAPLHPYVQADSGARIPWQRGTKFEAEIAVRLGRDLPIRREGSYSRADIVDTIDAVHLGAELLASAVEESGKTSFLLFLADRLGNSGYVLGPRVEKSAIDGASGTPLKITFNGQPIFDAPAQHPKGDVLTWLLAYANDGLRPNTSLKAGALVTTGTLCGAIELVTPGDIEIAFGDTAFFRFALV